MKFIIERNSLIRPLQQITGLSGGRSALPILGNFLIQATELGLSLTVTDLEIEIIVCLSSVQICETGDITVSIRKFFDICKSLPEESKITISVKEDKLYINAERSRFSLATLPAADFPNIDNQQDEVVNCVLEQSNLKKLMEATQFSMAHQDIRYYLNGMLLETEGKMFHTVATDGHRLAICTTEVNQILPQHSIIVPRKGVAEMVKLLCGSDKPVQLQMGKSNLRAIIGDCIFTTKLVDGQFPEYRRVFPQKPDKMLTVGCNNLKQALNRAAILSNEKFRGVRLQLSLNQLRITANNPEQEEAEEILDAEYQGVELEIGFNALYVLDVLNALKCDKVQIQFTDVVSSVQITDIMNPDFIYIVMPMRL